MTSSLVVPGLSKSQLEGGALSKLVITSTGTTSSDGITILGDDGDNRIGQIYIDNLGRLAFVNTAGGSDNIVCYSRMVFEADSQHRDNELAFFGDGPDYAIVHSTANQSFQIVDGSTVDTNVRLEIDSVGVTTLNNDLVVNNGSIELENIARISRQAGTNRIKLQVRNSGDTGWVDTFIGFENTVEIKDITGIATGGNFAIGLDTNINPDQPGLRLFEWDAGGGNDGDTWISYGSQSASTDLDSNVEFRYIQADGTNVINMILNSSGGIMSPNLKTGANQGAAGAAAGEQWVDTADQTIKLGV